MDVGLLSQCLIRDEFLLKREYQQILRIKDKAIQKQKLENLTEKIAVSSAQRQNRQAKPPTIEYPALPVVHHKDSILAALAQHAVVIVAGETGSGKTTQLPKICLEAGLGIRGMIGHTQPRRLAASAMANRIAAELNTALGNAVGYKVRFSDKTAASNYIKVMTDGILLSEIEQDKWLLAYDCLIIDEAHERSLNIDFLLGYLKKLLLKRHDLKVIVTSATIDVERFAKFFNDAPLITIEGRTYPVSVHYLPAMRENSLETTSEQIDPALQVLKAVEMAYHEGPGDILIFQSGEKEIREVAYVLTKRKFPNTHILPLYARQSVSEQQKIFQSSSQRKIIIATNVAETSITVPNIRFVIDSGLARISRYNYRNKMQRLPIEAISKASCEQRKGRCGRVGPGICYRLYSLDDYNQRAEFTEPEVLRTNLAGVILKMLSLGIKDLQAFPFIDPPDSRYIKDGIALLERLGAIENDYTITSIGRQLAQIPIEPRLARVIIAANQYGALKEILIIVSGLSIVDPRDRPHDQKEKADLKHAQFTDARSDFLSYLKLWEFIFEHKQNLSHKQFRLMCQENMLSFLRVCEWFDIHQQLTELTIELGFKQNQIAADYSLVHKALLTGLIDNIGVKQENKEYLGARNIKFYCHPASGLFKKMPTWIVCCEIVHTSRTYGRTLAAIDPLWIEEIATSLLKKHYFEPFFDAKEGRVLVFEKVTLFGIEIISKRRAIYEKFSPLMARKIFIQQALVDDQMQESLPFQTRNASLLAELTKWENKIRRQHYFIDEEFIFEFFDKQLPLTICSVKALKEFIKHQAENVLCFTAKEVSPHLLEEHYAKDFPDHLIIKEQPFALQYKFDLNAEDDGVTLVIPLKALKILKEIDFSWLIPGLLPEKIAALLKALPKRLRTSLSPFPEYVQQALSFLDPSQGSLLQALAAYVSKVLSLPLDLTVWATSRLDNYLIMHFKVVDDEEKELASGNDLRALYDTLKLSHKEEFSLSHSLAKKQLTKWDFGELPEKVKVKNASLQLDYYPALVDEQASVAISLFESKALADHQHVKGLTRLYALQLTDTLKYFNRNISAPQKKQLQKLFAGFGTFEELTHQLLYAVVFEILVANHPAVRKQSAFEALLQEKKPQLLLELQNLLKVVEKTLIVFSEVKEKLAHLTVSKEHEYALKDMHAQLAELMTTHFILSTPAMILKRFPVYLAALLARLEKLPRQLARDKQLTNEIAIVQKMYQNKLQTKNINYLNWQDPLLLFKWKIEELRISLFAEKLKTLEVVSKARLLKILEKIE